MSGEVKFENAVIRQAEIYCSQQSLEHLNHTVELVVMYGDESTQKIGPHDSRYVGPLMMAAEVPRFSEMVGRMVRVKHTRDEVIAVAHALYDFEVTLNCSPPVPQDPKVCEAIFKEMA